jgi:rare lipoprotein A
MVMQLTRTFTLIVMVLRLGFTSMMETHSMPEKGVASYYTNDSVDPRWGGTTKSGEKFDESLFTVAVPPSQWKVLKGKKIKVTSLSSGKSVIVKVNDTGGFEKYGRSLDLSRAAFEAIANTSKGVDNVEWEVVEDGNGTE